MGSACDFGTDVFTASLMSKHGKLLDPMFSTLPLPVGHIYLHVAKLAALRLLI